MRKLKGHIKKLSYSRLAPLESTWFVYKLAASLGHSHAPHQIFYSHLQAFKQAIRSTC